MASKGSLTLAQSRKGRRPMRVTTMLRKDDDGTLFKHQRTKTAEPPPPPGVSVEKWDGILSAGKDWGKKLNLKAKEAGQYGKNSAGFDLQGKTEVHGLKVDIENRKGSVREGTNDDGSAWRTKYKTPYGYLQGTKGADGDEIDAYVGPKKDSTTAYVVHQKKDDGSHDEDTVMLGYGSKAEAKKDILRHYDDPKYVGSVTAIPVKELKGKLEAADGRKITKLSSGLASEQASLDYREGDPPHMTGSPALAKRKSGDVPTRDMPGGAPRAENRQDLRSTRVVGSLLPPEGLLDVGKTAELLSSETALGGQRKSYEGPTRPDAGAGLPEKHRLKGYPEQVPIELNDISTSASQDESKTSSLQLAVSDVAKKMSKNISKRTLDERGIPSSNREGSKDTGRGDSVFDILSGAAPADGYAKAAMIDELGRLGAVDDGPLHKLAEDVTRTEAEKSLKRLKQLEESAPGIGELARGAGVGSIVMPLSAMAWRAMAGPEARKPTPLYPGWRPLAATAAQGAVLGSLLPAGRHLLEQQAEKTELRRYLAEHQRGKLPQQIQKTLAPEPVKVGSKNSKDGTSSNYRHAGLVSQDRPEPTDQEYGDEKEEVKTSQEWGDWGEDTLEGGNFKQESHLPPFKNPKLRTKKGFATSQYSGPLGYGGFKQESYIPPFVSPPMKTAGPPPPKGKVKKAYDPSPVGGPGTLGNVDVPGMRKMRTPARGLEGSKNVAQIKETPPGPSIAQIAKPKGLGMPMAGATKATSSSASFSV